MPRLKKSTSVFGEKTIQRFIEKKPVGSADFNPCSLTKEIFAIIVIYSTAALIVLILFFSMNFYITVLVDGRNVFERQLILNNNPSFKMNGVVYAVDKSKYGLDEEIKLSITNSSDESIFLAPCQYFNKFEKKESQLWKQIIIDSCEEVTIENPDEFEKIPLKENQSISAVILGEGVWRGVSDIYMDCEKAEVGACKSKKIVYSNEFKIETPKKDVKSL